MKDGVKVLLVIVVVLALGIVLDIAGSAYGIWHTNTFGVKQENARYNVFKKNQAYIDGKVRELNNLKTQLDTTKNQADKETIKAQIKNDFLDIDPNDVPDGLRSFLVGIRGY